MMAALPFGLPNFGPQFMDSFPCTILLHSRKYHHTVPQGGRSCGMAATCSRWQNVHNAVDDLP